MLRTSLSRGGLRVIELHWYLICFISFTNWQKDKSKCYIRHASLSRGGLRMSCFKSLFNQTQMQKKNVTHDIRVSAGEGWGWGWGANGANILWASAPALSGGRHSTHTACTVANTNTNTNTGGRRFLLLHWFLYRNEGSLPTFSAKLGILSQLAWLCSMCGSNIGMHVRSIQVLGLQSELEEDLMQCATCLCICCYKERVSSAQGRKQAKSSSGGGRAQNIQEI